MIITTGVLGQPVLDNVPGLGVTITHTDGTAAAAIFPLGIPLGIDLEIVSENNREALKDLNTSRETAMTRNALNESTSARVDTTTTHTLLWSIKEALSKTLGCGLTASTQLFEIKGILQHNLGFIAKFEHFAGHKAMCCIENNMVFALACPQQVELGLDFQTILRWMKTMSIRSDR